YSRRGFPLTPAQPVPLPDQAAPMPEPPPSEHHAPYLSTRRSGHELPRGFPGRFWAWFVDQTAPAPQPLRRECNRARPARRGGALGSQSLPPFAFHPEHQRRSCEWRDRDPLERQAREELPLRFRHLASRAHGRPRRRWVGRSTRSTVEGAPPLLPPS